MAIPSGLRSVTIIQQGSSHWHSMTAEVKAKVVEQKAYKAAQAKIASILADFKTQPAAQVVAKSQVTFEDAGTYARLRA